MSTSSTSRSRGSTFSSNVKTVALRPKFEPPGLIKIQDECSIVVLNSKCGFMSWYILEMCHRATQIIPGLIRSKNKFEERNKQLELLARLRATDVRKWKMVAAFSLSYPHLSSPVDDVTDHTEKVAEA